jgi:hypothetical protein
VATVSELDYYLRCDKICHSVSFRKGISDLELVLRTGSMDYMEKMKLFSCLSRRLKMDKNALVDRAVMVSFG